MADIFYEKFMRCAKVSGIFCWLCFSGRADWLGRRTPVTWQCVSLGYPLFWHYVTSTDDSSANPCRESLSFIIQPESELLSKSIGDFTAFGAPIGSASASHQCSPGPIRGWGPDPGAESEKGLSSPVWAALCPWVETLSCWPSLPASTNPIRDTLKNSQHFSISLVLTVCPLLDALIARIPADEEPLFMLLCVIIIIIIIIIIIVLAAWSGKPSNVVFSDWLLTV